MHRRLVEVGGSGISVRGLGGSRPGEMRITRFLRNAKVTFSEMFDQAFEETRSRVRGRHILAVQDTTTVRGRSDHTSLQVHPTLAVDALTGAVLGLVGGSFFDRKGGIKETRSKRRFEDKASYRWQEGAEMSARLCDAGAQGVTVVADREADIYDLFARKPEGVDLLVRASHDRALVEGGRAFDHVASMPELGRVTIDLPSRPGRKARHAHIALRSCAVTLRAPDTKGGEKRPDALPVYIIEAREVDPPDGQKGALWRLITTHKAETLDQVRTLVGFYRRRWTIEELFRTLKTRGFDIERVTIADGPFENLVCAALIAATHVMQLVAERDGKLARPVDDVIKPEDQPALLAVNKTLEGKTERQKNPHPPDTLAFAAWVMARLGGWTGYYGKPGPIVMLRGLHQFKAIQIGWVIRNM